MSFLTKLPFEIQDEIFSYLDTTSLLKLRGVSRRFNNDFLVTKAFRSCELKLTKEKAESFLYFCKNEMLTQVVVDFTMDYNLEYLGYNVDDLREERDPDDEDAKPLPEVIYDAIRAIPKAFPKLSTFCMLYSGEHQTDPYNDEPEGFAWDAYVKTLECIFPPISQTIKSTEDSKNPNKLGHGAASSDNPPSNIENINGSFEPIFPELKFLKLHKIDAAPTDVFKSPILRELLSRIENISVHADTNEDMEGAYFQQPYMNFSESCQEYFLTPLGSPIRSLDIRFNRKTWWHLETKFDQVNILKEHLRSLHLKKIMMYKDRILLLADMQALEDLTLVNCDVDLGEFSGGLGEYEIHWYVLWEKLLEREAKTGKKVFKHLKLEDSTYAHLDPGWGWHTIRWASLNNWSQGELAMIKEILVRDEEAYLKLGGVQEQYELVWEDEAREAEANDAPGE